MLCLQMKAMIARDIFNNEAFFKVINTDDASIRKAIEMLSGDYEKLGLKN